MPDPGFPAPDRHQSIGFGAPIVVLLLMLAALTGGLLQVAVDGQDRVAREASESIARAAFNTEHEALASLTRDWSWWNATLENLVFDFNEIWIEDNFGWLPDNYDVSRVYVLGPGREPLYGALEGEPVDTDSPAWHRPGLRALLDRTASLPEEPEASVSAYVELPDGIHLVCASKLLQEQAGDTSAHPPYPDKGILALTRKIDRALLDQIEADFRLPNLTLQTDPPAAGDRAALPLPGTGDQTTAYIVWDPPQPGRRLLEWLVLPLGAGFALAGIAMAVIIVRARRARLALQQAFEARVAAQNQLEHAARHDPLTDLPNRTLFLEHLSTAIAQARRDGIGFTLHSLDLDGFKPVNDTYGHPAGDELLRELAARLNRIVRGTDTLARFGGDELAVLQRSSDEPDEAVSLAARMIATVKQPFDITGGTVRITLSVGIAAGAGSAEEDAEALIRKADRALYRAKAGGGDRYAVYDPVLDSACP